MIMQMIPDEIQLTGQMQCSLYFVEIWITLPLQVLAGLTRVSIRLLLQVKCILKVMSNISK